MCSISGFLACVIASRETRYKYEHYFVYNFIMEYIFISIFAGR